MPTNDNPMRTSLNFTNLTSETSDIMTYVAVMYTKSMSSVIHQFTRWSPRSRA